MASKNKIQSNAQNLEELDLLTKESLQKSNQDYEKYLSKKVKRDNTRLQELAHIFKQENPNVIVNLPFYY
ncbi:hypothetical protein [Aquimarina longa]|uniref:hypothetical protein n=1 Tax=Aquimarina longa TaxID=1080221 RepID=UPI000780B6C7|nr:hypothetical protein [Aquimarina longa]